jgi:hypothetical protein
MNEIRIAQTPHKQRGPAASASNTYQYSGRAWGSQPPESGMFLPCCFACLVGCLWVVLPLSMVDNSAFSPTGLTARETHIILASQGALPSPHIK